MRFILLLYGDESQDLGPRDPGFDTLMGAYAAFGREVREAGVYLYGEPFRSSDTAKSLRLRNRRIDCTDGPFLQTREQLGGFYILECASGEEARAWAVKIPAAKSGSVEVRLMGGHDTNIIDIPGKERLVVLIYGDESQFTRGGDPQVMDAHQAFSRKLRDAGEFVAGDGFALSQYARTVRVGDGRTEITDGPFAETREVVGGFCELACSGLDRATELVSNLVRSGNGGFEVRPVLAMDT